MRDLIFDYFDVNGILSEKNPRFEFRKEAGSVGLRNETQHFLNATNGELNLLGLLNEFDTRASLDE